MQLWSTQKEEREPLGPRFSKLASSTVTVGFYTEMMMIAVCAVFRQFSQGAFGVGIQTRRARETQAQQGKGFLFRELQSSR
jgi:hypothetical protein